MSKFKSSLFSFVCLALVGGIFTSVSKINKQVETICLELPTELHTRANENGKIERENFDEVFSEVPLSDLGMPVITSETKLALQHQLHVLRERGLKDEQAGKLSASYQDLQTVLELLIAREGAQPSDLTQYLDAHQVRGADHQGNVHFTGYFTPVLIVKKQRDNRFKYPIYSFPENWKGKLPSRKEIEMKGALEGKGLELAYADNALDVYMMQLQGSGTVQFLETGERVIFRYAGENGHRYRNIQRFFRGRDDLSLNNLSPDGIRRFLIKHPQKVDSVLNYDPSYTFFTPKKGLVKGAAEVPLMQGISIAADSRYFPLGSVLLAAFPIVKDGRVTHHEYRFLLPQDVGGAVKGAGHLDVYCGNGELGQARASALHHYGQIWVLLPKKDQSVAMLGR